MEKKASYILSTYSFIYTQTIDVLLNTGYQTRNGNPIPSFDENILIDLCKEAQQIFADEENILKIQGDVIIVGDIHGSIHDLIRILKFNFDFETKILFLGDYVDRGHFSLECITLLFALKIMHPDSVYLIRGNHEFDSLCREYGFKDEILNYNNQDNLYEGHSMNSNCYSYTETLYDSFIQAFSYLPIGAVVNKTNFCIHGGLSPKIDYINTINTAIKRPINQFKESTLLSDLVWSDPTFAKNCTFEENPRGYGFLYSRQAVYYFLKKNSMNRIIRGHQCIKSGYKSNFDGKCITVFSASSYDQNAENDSAIIQLFQSDDSIKAITFPSICRLDKRQTFYFKVQPINQINNNSKHICFSILHPQLFQNPNECRINHNMNHRKTMTKRKVLIKYPNSASIVKPKFITNIKTPHVFIRYPSAVLKSVFSEIKYDKQQENDENNNKINTYNTFQ